MKLKLFAAATVAVAAFGATSTFAATYFNADHSESVTVTAVQLEPTPANPGFGTYALPTGETMIDDFDSPAASGFLVSGGHIIAAPGDPGHDAEPPGDTTSFMSVEGDNHPFTVTDTHGALTEISFYMGSPDSYNGLTMTINGGLGPIVLQGSDIWGGPLANPGNGDQTNGFLVTYKFSPNSVHSLTFSSTTNSFEFDNLAGTSVPEPASWALMIMGLGVAGGMLRAKRRLALTA